MCQLLSAKTPCPTERIDRFRNWFPLWHIKGVVGQCDELRHRLRQLSRERTNERKTFTLSSSPSEVLFCLSINADVQTPKGRLQALLMKNRRRGQRSLLSRSNKDFFSSRVVCLCQLEGRDGVSIWAQRFVYFNALVALPLCLKNCSARSATSWRVHFHLIKRTIHSHRCVFFLLRRRRRRDTFSLSDLWHSTSFVCLLLSGWQTQVLSPLHPRLTVVSRQIEKTTRKVSVFLPRERMNDHC